MFRPVSTGRELGDDQKENGCWGDRFLLRELQGVDHRVLLWYPNRGRMLSKCNPEYRRSCACSLSTGEWNRVVSMPASHGSSADGGRAWDLGMEEASDLLWLWLGRNGCCSESLVWWAEWHQNQVCSWNLHRERRVLWMAGEVGQSFQESDCHLLLSWRSPELSNMIVSAWLGHEGTGSWLWCGQWLGPALCLFSDDVSEPYMQPGRTLHKSDPHCDGKTSPSVRISLQPHSQGNTLQSDQRTEWDTGDAQTVYAVLTSLDRATSFSSMSSNTDSFQHTILPRVQNMVTYHIPSLDIHILTNCQSLTGASTVWRFPQIAKSILSWSQPVTEPSHVIFTSQVATLYRWDRPIWFFNQKCLDFLQTQQIRWLI